VPDGLAVSIRPSESIAVQWFALALTPRLGRTRARRRVEHFGGVQNIFQASLTELEHEHPDRFRPGAPYRPVDGVGA
jgi:hypothetical protein